MKNKNQTSQAVGLDIALKLSNFITGKDNMHYGLWDGLDITLDNLGIAQEAYTKKLLSYLPNNKSLDILDIGGGAGETAKLLISLGHKVTIVVPSPILASKAKENTNGIATVELCTFEEYKNQNNKAFDLCLFSESFQYIPLEIVLKKAQNLLAPQGHILIADCFRSEMYNKISHRPPGGGHYLRKMYAKINELNLSIEVKEDITSSVSASIDLEQKFYNTIGFSIKRVLEVLKFKHPILIRIIKLIYVILLNKKKRNGIKSRLFEKVRTAEDFEIYNHYMIFLLKNS